MTMAFTRDSAFGIFTGVQYFFIVICNSPFTRIFDLNSADEFSAFFGHCGRSEMEFPCGIGSWLYLRILWNGWGHSSETISLGPSCFICCTSFPHDATHERVYLEQFQWAYYLAQWNLAKSFIQSFKVHSFAKVVDALVVVLFLNWVLFLAAYVPTSSLLMDSFSLISAFNAIDVLCYLAEGDLYLTQCSLPRAIMGFDIVIW